MIKQLIVPVSILILLLALPFVLAPKQSKAVQETAGADCDRIVIVTAHNKALRDEYARAFSQWYAQNYHRRAVLDFRSPGGTSSIVRYIADRFEAEFRKEYEKHPEWGKWNGKIASSFSDPSRCRTQEQQEARKRFLNSNIGIGIDLFAGGGTFDHARMAKRGFSVDGGMRKSHPELFDEKIIPHQFGGDNLYDAQGRYYGVVLSTFGILYNADRLKEMKNSAPPVCWGDLGEPRFYNTLTVADPTKSGSANKCYEIMIQQCMAVKNDPVQGWADGLNLLKRLFANARTISESASQVVRDVASGEAAAGTAIDTYGISEMMWSQKVFGKPHCFYVTPKGGTAVSADPVQLLRGAPNRKAACAFIEFLLSKEGQLLHCLKQGVPGGPVFTGVNRPPVRRDLYTPELRKNFFLPGYNPYESGADFVYRAQWTARYYSLLRILLRTIALEVHSELQEAWSAIIRAGGPEKVPQAMAHFNALPFTYKEASGAWKLLQTGPERSAADVGKTLREWSEFAREHYKQAAILAAEGK